VVVLPVYIFIKKTSVRKWRYENINFVYFGTIILEMRTSKKFTIGANPIKEI